MPWETLLSGLLAYVLGSVPFGYLLYRFRAGGDIREMGSGNIGATNVFRAAGLASAVATLLLDVAKGYAAVLLATELSANSPVARGLAAFLVIVGHAFPIFLRFRGGKGVATALGAFLAASLPAVLITTAVFMLVAIVWRYVSLASIVAAAAFPIILAAGGDASPPLLAAALLGSGLIIARHRSNIHRLRMGTESPIVPRKGSSSG